MIRTCDHILNTLNTTQIYIFDFRILACLYEVVKLLGYGLIKNRFYMRFCDGMLIIEKERSLFLILRKLYAMIFHLFETDTPILRSLPRS